MELLDSMKLHYRVIPRYLAFLGNFSDKNDDSLSRRMVVGNRVYTDAEKVTVYYQKSSFYTERMNIEVLK